MDLLPALVNRLIAIRLSRRHRHLYDWLVRRNPRELGQNGWKVVLPSARLTLLQILIGVVDLGFLCAGDVHPDAARSPIDFMSLAVVFILATLLGFASHAPGQSRRLRRRDAGRAARIR